MRTSTKVESNISRIISSVIAIALSIGLMPAVPASANEYGARSYAGYSDVLPTDWYVVSGDFDYAVSKGLLSGYGNGTFGPYDSISRGQVATVLWRMAGAPSVETAHFDDVDYSQYYGTAISWIRLNNIATGYAGTNSFGPDDPVTREQLCVMLANYARKLCDIETVYANVGLPEMAQLEDYEDISTWAFTEFGWCVDEGIISGERAGERSFANPQGVAQRCMFAKMASILYRDVLDEDGCLLDSGGVWHYEFISIDFPAGWRDAVSIRTQGSPSGIWSTSIYLHDDYHSAMYRMDFAPWDKGWHEYSIGLEEFAFDAANHLWAASRGEPFNSGYSVDDEKKILLFATWGCMDASDVSKHPSMASANSMARNLSGTANLRLYVK